MAVTALKVDDVFAEEFVVLKKLSEGGMGAVYVVEHVKTRKRRALKIMLGELYHGMRADFINEAMAAAKVGSGHVVEVIDAGIDSATDTPWLTMELLEGEDLEKISSRRRMSPSEVHEVFAMLCHGLGAAHEARLVHRDLKPANLFMAKSNTVGQKDVLKILDFGIAKSVAPDRTSVTMKGIAGTPGWFAPEQAGGSGKISPATDVWALGLIAFRLLVGRDYWRAQGAWPLIAEMQEALVSASNRAKEYGAAGCIPDGFDAWFARCLMHDPKQRYANADDAMQALSPILSLNDDGPAPEPEPKPRPRPTVIAIAAAFAAMVSVVGWYAWREHNREYILTPDGRIAADSEEGKRTLADAARTRSQLPPPNMPKAAALIAAPTSGSDGTPDKTPPSQTTPVALRDGETKADKRVAREPVEDGKSDPPAPGDSVPSAEGPGYILVRSKPDGAEISVDGRLTRYLTPARISLPAGKHIIRMRNPENSEATATKTVQVKNGMTSKVYGDVGVWVDPFLQ